MPTMATVSVCPYPSRMIRPVARFQASMTSGLSGSPALTTWRSAGKRHLPRSSSTMARQAVGGAQNVDTFSRAIRSRMALASKRPRKS